jgi:hypothetical protein
MLLSNSQFNTRKTESHDVVENFMTHLITKAKRTDITPLSTCHILFYILVREEFLKNKLAFSRLINTTVVKYFYFRFML